MRLNLEDASGTQFALVIITRAGRQAPPICFGSMGGDEKRKKELDPAAPPTESRGGECPRRREEAAQGGEGARMRDFGPWAMTLIFLVRYRQMFLVSVQL